MVVMSVAKSVVRWVSTMAGKSAELLVSIIAVAYSVVKSVVSTVDTMVVMSVVNSIEWWVSTMAGRSAGLLVSIIAVAYSVVKTVVSMVE